MEKIALSERSKAMITNYLLGGAALGGSAALATSLVNYLKELKEKVKSQDSSEDDDTLYINIDKPGEKSASWDLAAPGLAYTSGALGAVGAYALIRKAYQKIKMQQLQEELDRAQQSFLSAAKEEAKVKKAFFGKERPEGEAMGFGEGVTGLPVAFALLSALAAGALTNKALEKTFPAVKRKRESSLSPKKVVIRKTPEELNKDEDSEKQAYDKLAASEQFDDGLEFLIHLCGGSKSASQSELFDIVHAVAYGRGEEFKDNMLEYGFDHAMTTIKGAAELPVTPTQRQLAIGYCVKSASISPVVAMLAAAEYNDMAPKFTKIAHLQSEEVQEVLLKLAGVLGAISRANTTSHITKNIELEKQAIDLPIDKLLELINEQESSDEEDDIEQNEDLNAEDSIDSNEEKKVNDRKPLATNKIAPEIINELDEQDDIIDQAMSTPVTPAKAVAVESKHK